MTFVRKECCYRSCNWNNSEAINIGIWLHNLCMSSYIQTLNSAHINDDRESLLELQKERFYHKRWRETAVALSEAVLKIASTGLCVHLFNCIHQLSNRESCLVAILFFYVSNKT